jgi:redox-sensitive bicupin YhaK (pirin superfamily)
MSEERKIKKVMKSKPTIEGAGVHLKRAFGFGETDLFDPFLLLDDFRGDDPELYRRGFPWHPHRGIETITYVLRGTVEHGDSLGNGGVIGAGDIQWMSAGSGIIHQEMPSGDAEGRMHGFQLWANLPRANKMMKPRYQEAKNMEIPVVTVAKGVTIRVICGEVAGQRGPIQNVIIEPEYVDVTIPAGTTYSHPTVRGHTVFAYVIEGQGLFCGEKDPYTYEAEGINYFDTQREAMLGNGTLIVFSDGDQIQVASGESGIRFLLMSGRPIHEPVAWYGPIVMNTAEELRTAFEELQNGSFIK